MENRTAIVTGAAGSLGRAIVFALRDRGCRIVALDRDRAGLDAFASEKGVFASACDLLDAAVVDQRISEAWEQHGPLAIVVNAIGWIHSAPLINIAARSDRRHSFEAWQRVIDLNLNTVFLATASVVDRMVANRIKGVIVNLSSVAAAGNAGQSAYSAAKAGVNAMTKSWAKELGPLGIRFVAISPGFIDTPSTRAALASAGLDEWTRRTPLRRMGSVENVTDAVMFAITNEYLTGKVIEIDGGLTI